MTKPVKTPKKRGYSSPIRAEQARQTRVRILEAAWEEFAANGYARTTIKAIAAQAGVAPDTVYTVFGTKVRVLMALIDLRLAPEGEDNVTDRPDAQAVRDATDQREQIHLFARDIAGVSARMRPVLAIVRSAAGEPDLVPVFANMDAQRLVNMRRVAEWIAARGPLRFDVARAAVDIWTLASPELARMLCEVQGWSEAEYAEWLEDVLVRVLLPDTPTRARPRRGSR